MERVPDIGPATIEALRLAGITSLSDVLRVQDCPKGVRADRWAKLKEAAAVSGPSKSESGGGNVVAFTKHNWFNRVCHTEGKPKIYFPGRIGALYVMTAPPYFVRMEFTFYDKDRGSIKRLHSPWYLFNVDLLFFNRRLKITEDGDQGAPPDLADLMPTTPLPVLTVEPDPDVKEVRDRIDQILHELKEIQMNFRN